MNQEYLYIPKGKPASPDGRYKQLYNGLTAFFFWDTVTVGIGLILFYSVVLPALLATGNITMDDISQALHNHVTVLSFFFATLICIVYPIIYYTYITMVVPPGRRAKILWACYKAGFVVFVRIGFIMTLFLFFVGFMMKYRRIVYGYDEYGNLRMFYEYDDEYFVRV